MATTLFLSCGESGTEPVPPPAPVATTVSVTPTSAALAAIGETIRFTAEVRDQNGQPMAGAPVTWSSSDPSVASVDAVGLVTAAANGTTTITAISGSVSGEAAVTVAQSASTVVVSPDSAALLVGDTLRLSATVLDALGADVEGAEVAWSSGDTLVATVDAAGLAMGRGPGETTITATSGAASGSATLRVEQSAATVAVSPDSAALLVGDTVRLSATVLDALGVEVVGAEVSWSSGDTLVATVDVGGLATGIGAGEVGITATSAGVEGRARLVVAVAAPKTVAVVPDSVSLTALGDTVRLAAEVFDQVGRSMPGAAVAWSSGDSAVASVDSAGLVRAEGSGTVTVTASSGSASGSASVLVMQSASSVAVTPAEATVGLGDTLRLAAEALDANGHPVSGAEFSWSSSDPSVVSVDGLGLVTGVAEGSATITAATGGAEGTAEITATNPDRAALVALYEATDGPNWLRSDNWLTDAPLADWYGVRVNAVGRVTQLDLGEWTTENKPPGNNLTGQLPSELGNLTNLRSLFLRGDNLFGPIPPELGNLTNLRTVDLRANALSGAIPPELGNLTSLTSLWLDDNNLSGAIPLELGNLTSLVFLELRANNLSGAIPPELGNLANLTHLSFTWNDLSDSIPSELGNLTNLRTLSLADNNLTGRIPSELGNLTNLRTLSLADNNLTGRIPSELGDIPRLEELNIQRNALTGPIPRELGNLVQLKSLAFHANALSGAIPQELGNLANLTGLFLGRNNLVGPIPTELGRLSNLEVLEVFNNRLSGQVPSELGNLASLRSLWIGDNPDLAGPLPSELTSLGLQTFWFSGTGLCVPRTQAFETWLLGIEEVFGGQEPTYCDELPTQREVLDALYQSTGGGGWRVATNWLSDAPLDDWYGVTTDSDDAVTAIALPNNDLSGGLPLEIGDLSALTEIAMHDNAALAGELPQGMVRLGSLATLRLDGTELCAPPNRSFGDWLHRITDARVMECADDHGNDATSATDIALGGLAAGRLDYSEDEDWFRFQIPRRGTLNLRTTGDTEVWLELEGNDREPWGEGSGSDGLVRRVTPGRYLVGVSGVRANATGAYALELSLDSLAPPADAYLTQAVQSHDGAVPLVAGEDALLRVFVTAPEAVDATMPPVRATFHRDGAVTSVVDIPADSARIPAQTREDDLDVTANSVIPGSVVAPGLEMVVEIDPDGTLDPSLGIGGRFPVEGRLAIDVRRMPGFHVTAVPLLYAQNPDSSGFKATVGLTAEHDVFYETRDWLPVADMEVVVREPLLVDYDPREYMVRALDDIELLRVADGASGYYMGVPPWLERGTVGVAFAPGRSSVSRFEGHTLAHEFGHNLSLRHAPCGEPADVDPRYPHRGGLVGSWGYDFTASELVNPEWHTDLMTYCRENDWISDYSFSKAADYRTETGASRLMASRAGTADRVLIVRGGRQGGRLRLDPAFVLDAPPMLPDAPGPYRLSGTDAAGRELFSHRFAMSEIADTEEGAASFVFALPAPDAWAGALDRITLTGPEGTAELGRDGAAVERLVLDEDSGRIGAILRGEAALADARTAVGPRPTLTLLSRGIPNARAWRR